MNQNRSVIANMALEELARQGMGSSDVQALVDRIRLVSASPEEQWRVFLKENFSRNSVSFPLFQAAFEEIYAEALTPGSSGYAPVWWPESQEVLKDPLALLIKETGVTDYPALHRWSTEDRERFWKKMFEEFRIVLRRPPEIFLDVSQGIDRARWLVGARMNLADSLLQAPPQKTAVIFRDEYGWSGSVTYEDLNRLSDRVAYSLRSLGLQAGDQIVIHMPMSLDSITLELGAMKAGVVVVSMATSFAAKEIQDRLALVDAKFIFTQHTFLRAGKTTPIYEVACQAKAPRAVVLQQHPQPTDLRPGDLLFVDFLQQGSDEPFASIDREPCEPTAILFSSGTTGKSKPIIWDSLTMIRSAVDARYHHGVGPQDRVHWMTEPGWMMNRYVIAAALLNQATLTIFTGATSVPAYGQFLEETATTMVGVVPDFVHGWRESGILEKFDLTRVRRFVSTGKPSNRRDYLYLSYLTSGRAAVLEYLGGTEIGGGYVSGTMIHPSVLSAFPVWALGLNGVFKTGDGKLIPAEQAPPGTVGEYLIKGPSIGLSQRMWRDPDGRQHFASYYEGAPTDADGTRLRKHGDVFEVLGGGYLRSLGRTGAGQINPGGIGCPVVKLEELAATHPLVIEAAAAEILSQEGDSQLVFFVVPRQKLDSQSKSRVMKELSAILKSNYNKSLRIDDILLVDALPKTPTAKVQHPLLDKMYQATRISNRPEDHVWSIAELRALIA